MPKKKKKDKSVTPSSEPKSRYQKSADNARGPVTIDEMKEIAERLNAAAKSILDTRFCVEMAGDTYLADVFGKTKGDRGADLVDRFAVALKKALVTEYPKLRLFGEDE